MTTQPRIDRKKVTLFIVFIAILIVFGVTRVPSWAKSIQAGAGSQTYQDAQGNKVNFPLGVTSFADQVVDKVVGNPAPVAEYSEPKRALGKPDYIDEPHDATKPADYSMGCGGTLTLQFTDNVLIDKPGPDLYVFEVGPAVEPTMVEISKDNTNWVTVGNTKGGTSSLDIHTVSHLGDAFPYVRLTDLKSNCGGEFSGADIDAVGAIHSTVQKH